jgi:tRNA (cmo5U34)-methyltransferase
MEDRVYASKLDWVENFQFDEKVALVFQDMITRSVPGYRTTLAMIGVIVARFVQPGSNVYDLGCSLGAGTHIAANARTDLTYAVIGVDTSAPMLERCRASFDASPARADVTLLQADIRHTPIENASVVILNFTLQFLPPSDRLKLLTRICQGLKPGGVLILSEKIHFPSSGQEDLLYKLHHDFKRRNGYSDLEISQKRSALENTLITETLEVHSNRLHASGFSQVFPWFQCFNFASILAIRE